MFHDNIKIWIVGREDLHFHVAQKMIDLFTKLIDLCHTQSLVDIKCCRK